MKRQIRTPYFEIGTKNYIYGDTVLEYALAADAAAEKYDIDVLFITPAVEIRRVVEQTKHLIVLAPYMDTLRPGRGMADILPEALKAAGAAGVVVNHCEKPMSLPQIKKTIDRAHELDMLVFACADTVAEAKAIAELHPDIINPEPSELIGGAAARSAAWSYVKDCIDAIKAIDPVDSGRAGGRHYERSAGLRLYHGRLRGGRRGFRHHEREGSARHDRRDDRGDTACRRRSEEQEVRTGWYFRNPSRCGRTTRPAPSIM